MSDQALARPVGWWLKEADAVLDAAFERQLQGLDVDRRAWQVLTSLARRPSSRADLVTVLARFDPPEVVDQVIDGLLARAWVVESVTDRGELRLSPDGVREQAALAPRVDVVRTQVAAALPDGDYRTLVLLLERLVAGLQP